ncbi:unnamed protein product [Owenia fusiformis]|uniref:Uncharacterized protein n=2 Tax=Owenia fusiformis TaxID=6347 RepID=A0A8J1XSY9_OWEFU|nr:unnamed protein product [Owenia fusiformis]
MTDKGLTEGSESMMENIPAEETEMEPLKKPEKEEYEIVEEYDPPIDRGYAWVVVFGCYLMNVLFAGCFKSIGILFVEIVEYYGASSGMSSLVVGIFGLFSALCGPIGTGLGAAYSIRWTVIGAGVLCGLGPILTVFAPNIGSVVFFYGFVTGCGAGLAYGPSYVLLVTYFKNRRSLANGISMAGSATGQLLYPILLRYMLDNLGFKNSLLIVGAINFNIIVCGALYRPLSFYRRKVRRKITKDNTMVETEDKDDLNDTNEPLMKKPIHKSIEYLKSSDYEFRDHNLDRKKSQSENLINGQNTSTPISPKKLFASNVSLAEASFQAYEENEQKARSQTDTDTPKDIEPKEKLSFRQKLTKLRASIKKGASVFDVSLITNAVFLLFATSCMICSMAYSSQFVYTTPFGYETGMTKTKASLLVTIMGAGDFFARISCGWFGDLGYVKRIHIVAVGMFMPGMLSIILPFIKGEIVFYVYAVLIGIFGGTFMALLAVVLVDLLGMDALAPAMGIGMMFVGLGYLGGPMIVGILQDVTGTYDVSFIVVGVLNLLAFTLLLLNPLAKRYQNKKDRLKEEKLERLKEEENVKDAEAVSSNDVFIDGNIASKDDDVTKSDMTKASLMNNDNSKNNANDNVGGDGDKITDGDPKVDDIPQVNVIKNNGLQEEAEANGKLELNHKM